METRSAVERIAKLRENEIGPTEENVKQKVIVPILELLGHNRENLEFEYRTRGGGKLDILIEKVPSDCKVIIDTKNYSENLNDHVDQIIEYTFGEMGLSRIEMERIRKGVEREFPNGPALQQVHMARKIIAAKAEREGVSFIDYIGAHEAEIAHVSKT